MSYTYAGQYGADQIINAAGVPQPSVAVTVYLQGTNTPATLYTDRTKATGAANPVSTDTAGNLIFFADPGRYDLAVAGFANRATVEVALDPSELGAYVTPASSSHITAASHRLTYFNPLDYGVDPTGTSLADMAMANCISDAMAVAGKILVPPNTKIRVSQPLIFQSGLSASTVPVPYASLVGDMPPGRIGDATDDSSVEILCDATYPTGKPVIQYLAPNNNVAPSGFELANLGIKCASLGGGVLVVQPRMARVAYLSIDHAADASGAGTPVGAAATGAFTAWSINGTAPAYNEFDHIVTSYAAKDGFAHNLAADDVFVAPSDLNAARYAFNCQGSARYLAPHYEASQYGFLVVPGTVSIVIIGADFFGVPTVNAVQLQSNFSSGINNSAQFIGCRLAVNPGAYASTSVPIYTNGSNVILAELVGCDIIAEGLTEYYVQDTAPAGSRIRFTNCSFNGTVNNGKYATTNGAVAFAQCTGINPLGHAASQPGVPASGTAVTNNTGVDCTVFVTGGTVSAIAIGGTSTGLTSGSFRVPVGQTITLTYTGAPTWQWFGD